MSLQDLVIQDPAAGSCGGSTEGEVGKRSRRLTCCECLVHTTNGTAEHPLCWKVGGKPARMT